VENLPRCPVCSHTSSDAKVCYRRGDDALVRCTDCGLIYANPQYTPTELVELYRRLYYNEENTLQGDFREDEHGRNRVLYRTVLDDLQRRYPHLAKPPHDRPLRALDYGCGPGYFLVACRARNFDVTGIEFSEIAARYGREQLGLNVITDPDAALPQLPDAHYDLVTAWAVIEHTRRPREVLEQLTAKLAPGGVLCLTLPNLRCWRYLIERGRWFNIANPTHLIFFDRACITRLLGELGLAGATRPLFWGGRPGFGLAANALQYLVRAADVGSDLRIYAHKPASAAVSAAPEYRQSAAGSREGPA
jgi:2-polyprenyl-3-methyl-5-hydroxy-6-metoxy-1,4-benzoquinol methylase